MKLSISNIAWVPERDEEMHTYIRGMGYTGLEIAPTHLFVNAPYDHLSEAKAWADRLLQKHGLIISSMQSIWYGRTEKIFASKEERQALIEYTKKAILFAQSIKCPNLVFGNPRNRDAESADMHIALDFFREIGDYAAAHNTAIALEPNPVIYNTRFMNYTEQAFEMASLIQSPGIRVNVDFGTMIYNNESPELLKSMPEYINHVHVSEPWLKPIEQRDAHQHLFNVLESVSYERFVSIEMAKPTSHTDVEKACAYIRDLSSRPVCERVNPLLQGLRNS